MSSPLLGLADGIGPDERDRAERLLERLPSLRVSEVRAEISASAWRTPEGRAWIEALLPRLAEKARVLPSFAPAPEYADFVDDAVSALGEWFDHVEIAASVDAESVESAAIRIWRHGKGTVLGGVEPSDADLLRSLGDRGMLARMDAVGIRARGGVSDPGDGWGAALLRLKQSLETVAPEAELWITEAGYSTWRHDEFNQVKAFLDLLDLPVRRIYWCAMEDRDPDAGADVRLTGFGLWTTAGHPKLLTRLWSRHGLDGVRETSRLAGAHPLRAARPVLITGGAGFVGTNLADRLLSEGRPVVLYDSLDRPGTEDNLRWLGEKHGENLEVVIADVRDRQALRPHVRRASAVFHLAAQVAVTSSLTDPAHDFEVNADRKSVV